MRVADLKHLEGQLGVLRFTDGHTVKARLVHVDADDRNEVIYDVIEVVAVGQAKWAGVKPGTTAAAARDDVADFTVLDQRS
jgi:hypothetical protein